MYLSLHSLSTLIAKPGPSKHTFRSTIIFVHFFFFFLKKNIIPFGKSFSEDLNVLSYE